MNYRLILPGILWVLVLSGCQNDDTKTFSVSATINEICHRVENCSGTKFTAQELQACKQVALTVGLVLPDAEYFSDCFAQLTCTQLLSVEDDPDIIRQCLNLDPASVYCEDNNTLLACSNHGVCSAITCSEACSAVSAHTVGCGDSSDHPYEVCLCSY
jgi:hypothetical protein